MRRKSTKKKISPLTIFAILTFVTIILSALLPILGNIKINGIYPLSWLSSGEYTTINAITGEQYNKTILVESVLNTKGIQYLFTNVVSNFISFAPLGYLFIALIGISVFDKSGLLKIISTFFEGKISNFVVTLFIITLGVISSIFGDVGYVVLIPLAAIIFSNKKRNPIGGIVAAFAGIAGGYGINFWISNLDFSFAKYSTEAAKLLGDKYSVGIYGNLFFIIIASILIIIIGTIVTEKIVMVKFPIKKYDTDEFIIISKKEKRGILFSGIATLVMVLVILYMIIPGLPYSGMLLDSSKTSYIEKLFSPTSPFNNSIIFLITTIMFVSGLFYSIGSKTIGEKNSLTNMIMSSKNNMGYLIILMFFASMFISIFKYTNIGQIICIWMLNILKAINPSGVPLILIAFVLFMISNLFLTSPILKWAIFAPTIIQMFTVSYISPEFAQIIYRTSISASNLITPMLAYYIIYLGYLQIYNNKEEVITLSDSYKYTIPYFIFFALTFLILIIIWYIINLPIGPGVLPIM